MKEIILGIAYNFDSSLALEMTRWNAVLWSIADIVICVLFLDLADRVRADARKGRRAYVRWGIFAATIIATPRLLYAASQRELFMLEAFICGFQFLVLIWTAIGDARSFLHFYHSYFHSQS